MGFRCWSNGWGLYYCQCRKGSPGEDGASPLIDLLWYDTSLISWLEWKKTRLIVPNKNRVKGQNHWSWQCCPTDWTLTNDWWFRETHVVWVPTIIKILIIINDSIVLKVDNSKWWLVSFKLFTTWGNFIMQIINYTLSQTSANGHFP